LKSHKIGSGKTITSHPVVGDEMKEAGRQSLISLLKIFTHTINVNNLAESYGFS